MDCVEVCPVDCFYEGENMLVIHPDECIDCGVCEPECPVEAIKPDTEPGLEELLKLNAEYAKIWPNITAKKRAAGGRQGVGGRAGQAREAFLAEPGQGRLDHAEVAALTISRKNAHRNRACLKCRFAIARKALIFAENVLY